MVKSRIQERRRRRKGRTNLGRYMSLEYGYWNGRLTDEQRERFEDVVSALRSLYREAARL